MEEVIKLDEVDKYNKLFGLETRHPLVSVVDLSKATQWPEHFKINYGVYALFLKDTYCGNIMYGRQNYDYRTARLSVLLRDRWQKPRWLKMSNQTLMASCFTLI